MTFDAKPLQRQLINKGFLPAIGADGKPNDDGTFGTVTQGALVAYQESTKLAPTGKPDDDTMMSLGLITAKPAEVKWALPTFSVPAFASDYLLNFVTSKINWVAITGAALIIGVLNGWLGAIGLHLGPEANTAFAALLLALLNGLVIPILRTFFNKPKVVAGKAALT